MAMSEGEGCHMNQIWQNQSQNEPLILAKVFQFGKVQTGSEIL
jgi:hypothetical protein